MDTFIGLLLLFAVVAVFWTIAMGAFWLIAIAAVAALPGLFIVWLYSR